MGGVGRRPKKFFNEYFETNLTLEQHNWSEHTVGLSGPVRTRTIVVLFRDFDDRQQALRNSSRLKNTSIYVNEDLCKPSLQLRKVQLPQLKKARLEVRVAYFSHTKRSFALGPGISEGGGDSSAAAETLLSTQPRLNHSGTRLEDSIASLRTRTKTMNNALHVPGGRHQTR